MWSARVRKCICTVYGKRWGIFQKSAPNFEAADSDHNSNTLYIVHHDLLKGPIIMMNSLKDALT
jgi:hypothetical protein